MRRWSVVMLVWVGCARGDNDIDPSPVTLAPSGSSASESSGDPTTASGTGTSDGGSSTTTAAGTSTSPADTTEATTAGVDACTPEPTDDACFSCAKAHCCLALTECEADPMCSCALDCIEQGGMATPCSDMCGGMSTATSSLIGCAYIHCMTECEGI